LPFTLTDASNEGIAATVGMLPLTDGIASPLPCCEGIEPSIAVAILDDPDALGGIELFVAAAYEDRPTAGAMEFGPCEAEGDCFRAADCGREMLVGAGVFDC